MSRRAAGLALVACLLAVGCGQPGPTSGVGSPAVASPSGGSQANATPSTGAGSATPTTPAPSASVPPAPSPTPPSTELSLALEPFVDGLDSPVEVAWRPSAPDDLYIVEQSGRIRIVRDGKLVDPPFLDIAGLVTAGGEQGLLGLAFPADPADRRFYVYYTALDGSQVLASFTTTADTPDRVDPGTQRIVLDMPDRYANHNGGMLAFGADGYLYVGTGDGGGGGDPLGSGRSLDTLLAKVLRLDVSAGTDAKPYAIPPDNPFVATPGARPEIFVTGLRNPWRFRFDRATNDLWIADVGQGSWEEVDVVRAGTSGQDFGWNIMEGAHCYRKDTCDQTGLTLPVSNYGHDEGCSISGGAVYRGTAIPALVGRFVFSDYCSGRVWTIPTDGADLREPEPAIDSGRNISAIAEGHDGELYATDLGGVLLRVVSAPDS